jgi:hypothetical protein
MLLEILSERLDESLAQFITGALGTTWIARLEPVFDGPNILYSS